MTINAKSLESWTRDAVCSIRGAKDAISSNRRGLKDIEPGIVSKGYVW